MPAQHIKLTHNLITFKLISLNCEPSFLTSCSTKTDNVVTSYFITQEASSIEAQAKTS